MYFSLRRKAEPTELVGQFTSNAAGWLSKLKDRWPVPSVSSGCASRSQSVTGSMRASLAQPIFVPLYAVSDPIIMF